MQLSDDSALLRRYVEDHSDEAFDGLVARHINLVYSVALRHVGDPHHAEEITQAVFIILAKKAGQLRHDKALSSWLFQATRLTAGNFMRSESRRHSREQEAYMRSTLNESGNDVWPSIAPLLDTAVAGLSEKDRQAIVLRFYEGRNLRDVGATLGATEDAAEKRVARAVERLRKFFSKRGVALTAAAIASAASANSVQAAPVSLAATVAATAAKGAAVGGSTLSLVKGALKVMAWTKAKTAIIASSAIMLATVGTISVTSHFRHAHPSQTGRLKLPTGNVTPMVAYGYSRFAIFLASDGSLWSWGEERLGWPVLGLADANIHNTTALRRVGHDADWVNIAAGDSHCLAIKSDGTLWAWGMNHYYNLGDGTKTTRPEPVPSIPGNDWKQVAAGGIDSFGLKRDGTLWAWGGNGSGLLGTGDKKESPKARQVGTSANWKKVWAGGIQTVGLQTDGSLWFWGSRAGDGTATDNVLTPMRVSPDTNWVDVCYGYFTVFAIKSDGTLWCWGNKARFYTQTSSVDSKLTPLQVGKENDWQSCNSGAGGFYQLLTKKDGSLWAMDASEHRTVKPDAKYQPVKFQKIDWHKDFAAYTAGGDNIGVIMTRDGEVWTWGRVIGELSPKDFRGPKGEPLHPESRIIEKPWQLSNIDSGN